MRLIRSLLGAERVRVSVLLWMLLAFFFWNVTLANASFLTSTFTFLPNTLPNGPYGYTGHRVTSQPTRDSGASAWHVEPLNRLASRMFKAGQIPLWNPYSGAGSPLAANMQSGALYLPNALIYFAPDSAWALANDWMTLLGFFVASYFTYKFLRSIGVGGLGAIGSAVAYMFCGGLVFYIGTADWRVDVLIPMLIYAAEQLHIKTSISSVLFVAFCTFLVITAGMPEATLFALLLAALYYTYRVVADWGEGERRLYPLVRRLMLFAASVLWVRSELRV